MKIHLLLPITLCLLFSYHPVLAEDADAATSNKIVYIKVKPLTVNLRSKKKRFSFLKANIQLLVKGEKRAEKVTKALPAARHALIMYLSARTKKQANSIKHRQKLTQGALDAVNEELSGVAEDLSVQQLLITNFTVQ